MYQETVIMEASASDSSTIVSPVLTAMASNNQDISANKNFFGLLLELPVVNSAVLSVRNIIPENKYTGMVSNVATKLSSYAEANIYTLTPVEKSLSALDSKACQSLKSLETKYPILTKPTDELVEAVQKSVQELQENHPKVGTVVRLAKVSSEELISKVQKKVSDSEVSREKVVDSTRTLFGYVKDLSLDLVSKPKETFSKVKGVYESQSNLYVEKFSQKKQDLLSTYQNTQKSISEYVQTKQAALSEKRAQYASRLEELKVKYEARKTALSEKITPYGVSMFNYLPNRTTINEFMASQNKLSFVQNMESYKYITQRSTEYSTYILNYINSLNETYVLDRLNYLKEFMGVTKQKTE